MRVLWCLCRKRWGFCGVYVGKDEGSVVLCRKRWGFCRVYVGKDEGSVMFM